MKTVFYSPSLHLQDKPIKCQKCKKIIGKKDDTYEVFRGYYHRGDDGERMLFCQNCYQKTKKEIWKNYPNIVVNWHEKAKLGIPVTSEILKIHGKPIEKLYGAECLSCFRQIPMITKQANGYSPTEIEESLQVICPFCQSRRIKFKSFFPLINQATGRFHFYSWVVDKCLYCHKNKLLDILNFDDWEKEEKHSKSKEEYLDWVNENKTNWELFSPLKKEKDKRRGRKKDESCWCFVSEEKRNREIDFWQKNQSLHEFREPPQFKENTRIRQNLKKNSSSNSVFFVWLFLVVLFSFSFFLVYLSLRRNPKNGKKSS